MASSDSLQRPDSAEPMATVSHNNAPQAVATNDSGQDDLRALLQEHAREIRALSQNVLSIRSEIQAFMSGHSILLSEPDSRGSVASPPAEHRRSAAASRVSGGSATGSVQPQTQKADAPSISSRNLIVCIDGTSNQFSKKNTNVVELYHRLVKNEHQLTFYNSGIGTYATPSWKSWKYFKQVLYNKIDLAIAWNFEKILLSAYLWLSENYREGDKIFLFGFSRGAYQVRALSAMIKNVGLLYKGNQDQIPFAYQLYAETRHFDDIVDIKKMRERFKATFSSDVNVEFVGVWDTVSSVGLFRDKLLPGTAEGMTHVNYFRHALALHERRVKFLPEYSHQGSGPHEENTRAEPNRRPHTKEVWFAGSHSNIGGGFLPNETLDTFGPALRWMTFEAMLAGVLLKETPPRWENFEINNSLTAGWKIFEVLPFKHLTYDSEKNSTYWPHFGRQRRVMEHQLIHESALYQPHRIIPSGAPLINSQDYSNNIRYKLKFHVHRLLHQDKQYATERYRYEVLQWRAQLPESMEWTERAPWPKYIEQDSYTAAEQYVDKFLDPHFTILSRDEILGLKAVIHTDAGRNLIRNTPHAKKILNETLIRLVSQEDTAELANMLSTIEVLVLVVELCQFTEANIIINEARKYATNIATMDPLLAFKFMELFASRSAGISLVHERKVTTVTYMPDGNHIVTGSEDSAIRIWNLQSGEIVGDTMTGHREWVSSVSVSANGARIASGSNDKTICVWDASKQTKITVLEGHSGGVDSVAIFSDGSCVVSSSRDHTIRVWDVATANVTAAPINVRWSIRSIMQHHHPTLSLSPDGLRIVAGSYKNTVHVWDVKTGNEVWSAQMPYWDNSVAWSPDGALVVSGGRGHDLHVLNALTGELVLKLVGGHTHHVKSVAFSANGTHIASASLDGTVILWDAQTGAPRDVIWGHHGGVESISFSPDGRHIASVDEDKTVRIWDAAQEWQHF